MCVSKQRQKTHILSDILLTEAAIEGGKGAKAGDVLKTPRTISDRIRGGGAQLALYWGGPQLKRAMCSAVLALCCSRVPEFHPLKVHIWSAELRLYSLGNSEIPIKPLEQSSQ